MTLRRASVILPCHNWEDFPTHLGEQAAAELLTAWTALWHPALLAAVRALPGWHRADEPPEPASLEGELVLVPPPSRVRMPGDWLERMRLTEPANPSPIESVASRRETVRTLLASAGLEAHQCPDDCAADFHALGYAYLQVELLTRAMHYESILDTSNFEAAVVAAADAALRRDATVTNEELTRAFDLLADNRNHVYSVDYYVIDLTLVADSTLGDSLRSKLAARNLTSLLVTGAQLDRMAETEPATLSELKSAIDSGTASIVGGFQNAVGGVGSPSPERVLENLEEGQATARRHFDREFEVFGQFGSAFTHLLPDVLRNVGIRGALHVAFDGSQLPRAEQKKTYWGSSREASIEALSAVPLDAGRAETWLKLAERVGDSIAHDHVATILLASWPGAESDFFNDLRRASKFGTVLGKLITLDEYFRITREPDDWTRFFPREYPQSTGGGKANALSQSVDTYLAKLRGAHRQMGAGVAAIAGLALQAAEETVTSANSIAINPWNFECSQLVDIDFFGDGSVQPNAAVVPNVLACGYAAVGSSRASADVPLVEELKLRNERVEIDVSKKTGGIQSMRLHSDRSTRVSQRLVFHHELAGVVVESQMVADRVEVTRNDVHVGEITSSGRLFDSNKKLLANYTQRVRVVRGLVPVIVDVEIDPQQALGDDLWRSYFASRLVWPEEALTVRYGQQWMARETERERIVSSEWVEMDEVSGKMTVLAGGLPFHRRSAPNSLDTLLLVANEVRRRFQFAICLDQPMPTRAALGACTASDVCLAELSNAASAPAGWFLHLPAKNVVVTHIAPLAPPARGVSLRLLETEGRATRSSLSGFRLFQSAHVTDFRGAPLEVLSVTNGIAEIEIGAYRWVQVEAEWVG